MAETVLEMLGNTNFGGNVQIVATSDGCCVMKLTDKSGDGFMTLYEVWRGVYVMFNDFHLEQADSQYQNADTLLCIDHCREGCIEHQQENGTRYYMKSGEIRIDTRVHHEGMFYMPLHHYHGITIGFQTGLAEQSFKEKMPGMNIDLAALANKFCPDDREIVFTANNRLSALFSQLYDFPSTRRTEYFRLKVAELLLLLEILEPAECKFQKAYFPASQTDKVKEIHKFITQNCAQNYTLHELSERFGIGVSAMRRCFEGVYGSPIHRYLKSYRMNIAASMLSQSDKKINEISAAVGYDNPAKFAESFREIMGASPTEYRNTLR